MNYSLYCLICLVFLTWSIYHFVYICWYCKKSVSLGVTCICRYTDYNAFPVCPIRHDSLALSLCTHRRIVNQVNPFLSQKRFYSWRLPYNSENDIKDNKAAQVGYENKIVRQNAFKVNKTSGNPLNTSPDKNLPFKIVGETKHFPPANKEWLNSVYSYNKSNLRSTPGKDILARKLIKNYFNLSPNKSLARSRRKRDRIRKNTLSKLFISRPEVKQTNDKIILNVYTYDRKRQSLLRKLFLNIVSWEKWQRGDKIYLKRKVFKKGKWVWKVRKVIRGKDKLRYFKKYDSWRKAKMHKFSVKSLAKKVSVSFYKNKINEKGIVNLDKKAENRLNDNKSSAQCVNNLRSARIVKKPRQIKSPRLAKFIRLFKSRKKAKKLVINRFVKRNKYSSHIKHSFFQIISQRRKETEFVPKKVVYKFKSFLKGSWRVKSYKRFLRRRLKKFNPLGKRKSKKIQKKIPYFGLKHSNIMKYVNYVIKKTAKFKKAKNIMLYYCNSYVLSLLNIKIRLFEEQWDIKKKKMKKTMKINRHDKFANGTKFWKLKTRKEKKLMLMKAIPYYVSRSLKYKLPVARPKKIFFRIGKKEYSVLIKKFSYENINYLILKLIMKITTSFNLKLNIQDVISSYANNRFLNIFLKSLYKPRKKKRKGVRYKAFNRKALIINYALKFIINKSKFGSLLVGLKTLLSKIYNKKAELNIVNLKYPHLSTDIFSQAVAARLRKRASLLKVMRRSLQLARLPKRYLNRNVKYSVNKLEALNFHKSLKFEQLHNDNLLNKNLQLFAFNGKNFFQKTLNTLYAHSLVNQPKVIYNEKDKFNLQRYANKKKNAILNKVKSVLNTIKYKWVSGIRLEAAGRLTRRYTASRSVFKFRRKGSLQNIDYSRRLNYLKTSMPNVIFRNLMKSNSQYSFVNAKRRIGAYGIKTWMSSY